MSKISPIEELSMEGFQIVKAEMFAHLPRKGDATCTIGPTKLAFSKLVLSMLNNCEYVRIEVNPLSKRLLVVPVSSSDKNSIRWIKGQKEFTIRNMESKTFGDTVYQQWKLDPTMNYRAIGKLVSANQKVMMLFDFSEPEMWKRRGTEASSNEAK